MTENFLDSIVEEDKNISREKAYYKLRNILLSVVILVSVSIVLVCFSTIPWNAVVTWWPFSHMKAPYAVPLIVLTFLPIITLIPAFLFGFIPKRGLRYGQRVLIIFLSILLILLSITLFELISDSLR